MRRADGTRRLRGARCHAAAPPTTRSSGRTAQLARECHPDANPDDPDRGRPLQGDQRRVRDAARSRAAPPVRHVRRPTAAAARRPGNPFGAGQFGLNDLFDAFFSGDVFGGRGPAGARRGPDAETRDGAHARRGRDRASGARSRCACRSSATRATAPAAQPGTHPTRCANCDGAGEVRQVRRSLLGQIVTAGPCPKCCGARHHHRAPVPDVPRRRPRRRARARSTSRCPPGIDDGQRLRLAGRGPAAPRGGTPGDLYVARARRAQPDVRAARRRPLAPAAGVDRAGRARRARCSSRRSTARARSRCSRARSPARGCACRGLGVPSLRTGRRGDLVRRGRRAKCRPTSPPNRPSCSRSSRELRGEAGHAAARGAVLAHPVGLPDVTGPTCARPAAQDAAAHTFVDDARRHRRDHRRRRPPSATGAPARASASTSPSADGAGAWRRYEIEAVAPGRAPARRARRARRRAGARSRASSLAVALTKGGALDTVVARCTELGVARVVPVRTRRCVVRWDARAGRTGACSGCARPRARPRRSRAARGCPRSRRSATLADFASVPGAAIAASVASPTAARPLPEPKVLRLGRTNFESDLEWIVVVGPEGGLDPAELAAHGTSAAFRSRAARSAGRNGPDRRGRVIARSCRARCVDE